MRTRWATMAFVPALLVLGGCADPAPSGDDSVPPPAPQPFNPRFGCAGSIDSSQPCFAPWIPQAPEFAMPFGLVAHPSDPARLAMAMQSYAPAGPDAPVPEQGLITGRAAVAVSNDAGATWTQHLVPHGQPAGSQFGLKEGRVEWTPSGVLLYSAFLEETPYSSIGAGGGGIGTLGRAWVGRSTDGGASWSPTLVAPDGFAAVAIAAGATGAVIAAWMGPDGFLRLSASPDEGLSWGEPELGPTCYYPSTPFEWSGKFLLGCQDPFDSDQIGDLVVIAVDPRNASFAVQGRMQADKTCNHVGPVLDGDRLLAAQGCENTQFFASLDGGQSWVPEDPIVVELAPTETLSYMGVDAVGVTPEGIPIAIATYAFSDPDPICTCRTETYLIEESGAAWLVATYPSTDPPTAIWTRTEMATGADRLWILLGDGEGSLGWVKSRPVIA